MTIEWPPRFIGKESNKLEEVAEGRVPDTGDVYTEYPDQRRDEWATRILPILKAMPLSELIERSGFSRRALQMIRAGRRPNPDNGTVLAQIASLKERTSRSPK